MRYIRGSYVRPVLAVIKFGYDNSIVASTFTPGHMAIAAAAGLAVVILGATLVLLPKRKKKTAE